MALLQHQRTKVINRIVATYIELNKQYKTEDLNEFEWDKIEKNFLNAISCEFEVTMRTAREYLIIAKIKTNNLENQPLTESIIKSLQVKLN